MLPLLFVLVAGVACAPLSPEMPCLSKCFEESSLVAAANDLSNFRAISEGLEAFCGVNADLLRCGRECPEAEVHELEKRTSASSYICMEKAEEFRLISDCIKSKKDSVGRCAIDCQLDQQEAPLRFDSAPSALINPTVLLDSIKPNCNKHMCVVRCSIAALNGDCAGAGDLFKDLARHQVMAGVSRMEAESTGSDEMTKQLVLTYLNKLDTECPVMKDVHAFDKETAPGNTAGDSNAGSEMMTASMEKSTEKPELTTAGADKEEEKEGEKGEEEASGETTDATPEETTFEFEPVNEPEVPVGPPSESASTDAEVEPVTQAEIDEKIITNVHRETERPTVDDSALLTTERAEESTAKPEEKEEEKGEEEKEETTEAAEAIAAVGNSDEHKGVDSDGFDITVSTQSTVESKEEPKEEEPKEEEPKEEETKEEEPKEEEPKEEEPKEEEKEGETLIAEEAEPKEEESSDAAAGTTEAPVAETTPAEPVIVVNDEESKEVENNKVHPGLFEPHKANSVSTIAASALMAVAVFAAF